MKPQQILDLEKAWGIKIAKKSYLLNEVGELTKLNLSYSKITDISPLQGLSKLTGLYLSHNLITDISPLQRLSQLTKLNLWNNQITDISPLQGLSQLTQLYLASNQITDISPLQGLKQLTELSLWNNQITDISSLQGLSQLTELELSFNQITDIGPMQGLSQLTVVGLKYNQIKNINPLQGFNQLTILYLQSNQIKDVPDFFVEQGYNLWYERDILKINSTKFINLYDNPLQNPPKEIILEGMDAVRAWYVLQEKEASKGERPINEAKMIIIGEPEAGKTSLMNYLLGKPFAETKTTQGIKIEQWQIEDDIDKYRINVWDFGGQEIQSTVHRFFLTQDTLYVVLLNARKDETPDKYLEQIRSYAPNSPVLVVMNRMDENFGSIDESRLMAEYPMIKGFFKTSILKAHKELDAHFLPAVRALDDAIVQQLLAMPRLRESVPSNYFEVKSHLESRFFKDTPYISHDLYEQLCRDKNLELASDAALLKILDRLGTIRHFDETHTRNLHILNPEWLSDGVYRILTAKRTHDLEGVISESEFPRILHKGENHTFDYPKQYYGYLIEMIRQFHLGYIDTETKKIFIPQAFRSDYPERFDAEVFKKNALHFFFKYETHIPSGAISSFIARQFGHRQEQLYWQKGIVIQQEEAGETQVALVMQTDIRNRIDIWVQGSHRREFFIEIRKIFREFHDKYPGLKLDEMVGLDPKRLTAVKYRVLIAQKHKGKTDYVDEEGNDYRIDALLGSFESPTATQNAIYNNFEIKGDYYDMRGAKKIQFIKKEAQYIASELAELNIQASEQNQALLNKLIAELNALKASETPQKAKGILAQLKESAKNLPKIASEEAMKWATKKGLDGIPLKEKFEFLQEKVVNLLKDNNFKDLLTPDNWA